MWVKTKMRKMIYGVVAIRIEHPTMAEKASVKPYSNSDIIHMMLKLKHVLPLLPNPKNIICYIAFRFV